MALRIGSWLFHPDAVFLPLAGLFFIAISVRQLHPRVLPSRGDLWVVLTCACLGCFLGAKLYGMVHPWRFGEDVIANGAWTDLRFGSLGLPWGCLIATAAIAALRRLPLLKVMDALVPGLCICMAAARISCMFQRCCPGILLSGGFEPFRTWWPLWDIAALLSILPMLAALRRKHSLVNQDGAAVCFFLSWYGVLRFLLEFVKDTFTVAGPFTGGHALSALGLAVGAVGLVGLTRSRDTASECEEVSHAE